MSCRLRACAQVGKTFSLGSAMLGAPAADQYYASGQRIPDGLVLSFIEQHADAAMFVSLFRSCRGGRDLVLRSARKGALVLMCANLLPNAAWERQLRAARQALSVRGLRPTSVRVLQQTGPGFLDERKIYRVPSQERLVSVLNLLHGVGEGVTELDVDLSGYPDNKRFMRELAVACPNVSSLQLRYNSNSHPLLRPLPTWQKLQSRC